MFPHVLWIVYQITTSKQKGHGIHWYNQSEAQAGSLGLVLVSETTCGVTNEQDRLIVVVALGVYWSICAHTPAWSQKGSLLCESKQTEAVFVPLLLTSSKRHLNVLQEAVPLPPPQTHRGLETPVVTPHSHNSPFIAITGQFSSQLVFCTLLS